MKPVEEPAIATNELFERWRLLRERRGNRVDLLDLYDLVAEARGVAPELLSIEERAQLSERALPTMWPGYEQVAATRAAESVEVVDYDPTWPKQFEVVRRGLVEVLGASALRVDHIGSTSVPGLAAKPIIDIQISVIELTAENTYVHACHAAGYELFSRDNVHRFFHVPPPAPRSAQLHVCQSGEAFEREHLLFRDYLRGHAAASRLYATTKHAAAQQWHDDRTAYTYAKNDLILDLLDQATQWSAATGWTVAAASPN